MGDVQQLIVNLRGENSGERSSKIGDCSNENILPEKPLSIFLSMALLGYYKEGRVAVFRNEVVQRHYSAKGKRWNYF